MARQTEEIRRDIERKRNEIDEDIAMLRHELLERTDWRWQIRSKPLTAVGVALVLGVFAGLTLTR